MIAISMTFLGGCCAHNTGLDGLFSIETPAEQPAAVQKKVDKKAPSRQVVGWVEKVSIGDMDYQPRAKIDSGATTSSLGADIIRQFKRDGKDYIVFRTNFGDDNLEMQTFEAEITRWVRIKRKGGDGDFIRRPVVEMSICLGDHMITGEMNIADRDDFNHPVLVGRNMLAGKYLIDTAKRQISPPKCSKADDQI